MRLERKLLVERLFFSHARAVQRKETFTSATEKRIEPTAVPPLVSFSKESHGWLVNPLFLSRARHLTDRERNEPGEPLERVEEDRDGWR